MGVRKEREVFADIAMLREYRHESSVRSSGKTELLFIPRSVIEPVISTQSGGARVRHELCRDQLGGRVRRASLRSARQAQQDGTRRVRAQCRREARRRGQGDPQAGLARRPAPLCRAAGRSAHRAQRGQRGASACDARPRRNLRREGLRDAPGADVLGRRERRYAPARDSREDRPLHSRTQCQAARGAGRAHPLHRARIAAAEETRRAPQDTVDARPAYQARVRRAHHQALRVGRAGRGDGLRRRVSRDDLQALRHLDDARQAARTRQRHDAGRDARQPRARGRIARLHDARRAVHVRIAARLRPAVHRALGGLPLHRRVRRVEGMRLGGGPGDRLQEDDRRRIRARLERHVPAVHGRPGNGADVRVRARRGSGSSAISSRTARSCCIFSWRRS